MFLKNIYRIQQCAHTYKIHGTLNTFRVHNQKFAENAVDVGRPRIWPREMDKKEKLCQQFTKYILLFHLLIELKDSNTNQMNRTRNKSRKRKNAMFINLCVIKTNQM